MIEMYTFLAQEEDRLGDEDEDEGRIRRNLLNYDHSYILLVRADNFRVRFDLRFPLCCSAAWFDLRFLRTDLCVSTVSVLRRSRDIVSALRFFC